jgi:hypothetical protein
MTQASQVQQMVLVKHMTQELLSFSEMDLQVLVERYFLLLLPRTLNKLIQHLNLVLIMHIFPPSKENLFTRCNQRTRGKSERLERYFFFIFAYGS